MSDRGTEWRTGDLTALAAAIAVGVAAVTPWIEVSGGRVIFGSAAEIAFLLAIGLSLFAAGGMRTSATAGVAMVDAFLIAFVLFTSAIPAHAGGAHPGFGLFAMAAGGVLSLVAGVLNGIEREGRTF
jgi:hypothetical protein